MITRYNKLFDWSGTVALVGEAGEPVSASIRPDEVLIHRRSRVSSPALSGSFWTAPGPL